MTLKRKMRIHTFDPAQAAAILAGEPCSVPVPHPLAAERVAIHNGTEIVGRAYLPGAGTTTITADTIEHTADLVDGEKVRPICFPGEFVLWRDVLPTCIEDDLRPWTHQQPTQEHRERLVREVRAVAEHYREQWERNCWSLANVDVILRDSGHNAAFRSVERFFSGLLRQQELGLDEQSMRVAPIFIEVFDIEDICRAIEHDTSPDACTAIAAIVSITPHTPRQSDE